MKIRNRIAWSIFFTILAILLSELLSIIMPIVFVVIKAAFANEIVIISMSSLIIFSLIYWIMGLQND